MLNREDYYFRKLKKLINGFSFAVFILCSLEVKGQSGVPDSLPELQQVWQNCQKSDELGVWGDSLGQFLRGMYTIEDPAGSILETGSWVEQSRWRDLVTDEEKSNWGKVYVILGWAADAKSRYDEVPVWLEKARFLFLKVNQDPQYVARNVCLYLGSAYTRMGAYESANEVFEWGIRMIWDLPLKDAEALNILASLYSDRGIPLKEIGSEISGSQETGVFQAARENYHQGLELNPDSIFSLFRANLFVNLADLSLAESNLSEARCWLDSAEFAFDKALLENNAQKPYYPLYKAGYLHSRATLHLKAGELEAARIAVHDSRTLYQYFYSNPAFREFSKLDALEAEILIESGELQAALAKFVSGLKYLIPVDWDDSGKMVVDTMFLYPENAIQEAFTGIAKVHKVMYRRDSNLTHLHHALRAYHYAAKMVPLFWDQYRFRYSKGFLATEQHHRTDLALWCYAELYRRTRHRLWLQKAVELLEQNQSLLLREQLEAPPTENKYQQSRNFRSRIIKFETQYSRLRKEYQHLLAIREENDTLLEQSKHRTLDSLRQLMIDYNSWLARQEPALNTKQSLHAIIRPVRYDSLVKKVLNPFPGRVLLRFFWGQEHLYGFLLRTDSVFLHQIPLDQELRKVCREFPWLLANAPDQVDPAARRTEGQQYCKQAYLLYKTLIHPFLPQLKGVSSLIILPDGPLHNLPFDALLTEPVVWNQATQWERYPYLCRKYATAYQSSAALLTLSGTENSSQHTVSPFMAFFPRFFPGALSTWVPALEEHLNDMLQVYDQTFQMGLFINKAFFLDYAVRSKVLYLATHGNFNSGSPLDSYLLFSLKGQAEALYGHEILIRRFNTDLAILTACYGGAGNWAKGEGALGLKYAFLAAGCKSVLAAQWNLEAGRTSRFAPDLLFYRKLGLSLDQAVRMARLSYLWQQNGYDAHPGYWAGIRLFGDPQTRL